MKLSIVIPAYNEEKRLGKTLPDFIGYTKKFSEKYKVETEVIVVNDGSKDKMMDVLENFKNDIKVVSYYPNMGKGYALRQGLKVADGDISYIADSDLSTPIEYIDHFYKNMKDYDCVIGSRAMSAENVKVSLPRKILGKGANLLIRTILGLNFKDTQCGFKMFNDKAKKCMLECQNNRFGYDFEFLYLLQKNNLRIKEMPVKWSAVGESTVKPSSYFKTFAELLNVRRMHK